MPAQVRDPKPKTGAIAVHPTEQDLNPAQRRVLKAIREYIAETGISPTLRDLARKLGLASQSTVQFHLQKLKSLGAIEIRKNVPRSLRVLWPDSEVS